MEKIDRAVRDLRRMDEWADGSSPIHRLHPLTKLGATVAFLVVTVSFDKYDLPGLVGMVLWPALLFTLSGIPVRACFSQLRFVLPLVCLVGLFNPFFDRTPLWTLGTVTVSGGVVSMLTLMGKGLLCLSVSFLLAATTRIEALCAALRTLRVPELLVTLLLLTCRYVSVLVDEVAVMTTAYRLRAPGQRGVHISAWGSFLGQLLLRSMDRAQELYESMQLRGYHGDFPHARVPAPGWGDLWFALGAAGYLVLARGFGVTELLGRLMKGAL